MSVTNPNNPNNPSNPSMGYFSPVFTDPNNPDNPDSLDRLDSPDSLDSQCGCVLRIAGSSYYIPPASLDLSQSPRNTHRNNPYNVPNFPYPYNPDSPNSSSSPGAGFAGSEYVLPWVWRREGVREEEGKEKGLLGILAFDKSDNNPDSHLITLMITL